jgi:putative protease
LKRVELLSPAKTREYGEAAINHGADAVYIAGPRFGAREAAGNSIDDIERLCRYAHRYRARVYMALNTILFDAELEAAQHLATQAYECGCDALIVQDMSLLEMSLPPIALFASTQTDNRTPDKVRFLQDVGFSRVILARELSLTQIAAIRAATAVELETFVHGSLCVSYSGRCCLSEALLKRSANRGCCAQLCRLPYNLCDGNGQVIASNRQLLSLKDLNLSAQLGALLDVGVSSFKIEGRLKDLNYVKNITAYYRRCLDRVCSDRAGAVAALSSGCVELKFAPDPRKSFSRGFTDCFLSGDRRRGLNSASSKSVGEYCGTTLAVGARSFTMDAACGLANGDGICFFDRRGVLHGTGVNRAEIATLNSGQQVCEVFPLSMDGIAEAGIRIFRNADRRFDKALTGESATRKIRATASVAVSANEVRLAARDEDGVAVSVNLAHNLPAADNPQRLHDTIVAQLSKTGGDIFRFEIETVECAYFFPISQINHWRRQLVSALEAERERTRPRPPAAVPPSSVSDSRNSIVAENVANRLAAAFYRRHGVERIVPAVETGDARPDVLMHCKYCIKFELGICPAKQDGKPTGDLFLQYQGGKLKLEFDCSKCEMRVLSERSVYDDK